MKEQERSDAALGHESLPDYVDTSVEDAIEYATFRELDPRTYTGDDAELLIRWQALWALQEHYKDFRSFYHDCSNDLLGFVPTDMQYDIADYCQNSALRAMIQAQRSEAKTTIAGAYAVWCLIHNPGTIVLIISAGGDMAKDIATWVIQIINGMPELACMVPDKNHATTRTSMEKYDIHHDLKGVNKSASISCIGVTSNMQGKRAHLLVSDDVESSKNSATQLMRDQLLEKTKDFTSICTYGKILYLGTPQSTDSIYNTLPGRGYQLRIWPGRFPTMTELKNYGKHLAAFVLSRLTADPSLQSGGGPLGDRGRCTDPLMMSELASTAKEEDQGPAYYNLQYMLDTELADANRFPLKAVDMMFMPLDYEQAPGKFMWGPRPDNRIQLAPALNELNIRLHTPGNVHTETFDYESRVLSLDPAGEGKKNNDETGYAVVFTANGYYFVMAIGGIKNASSPEGQAELVALLQRYRITQIVVEKNFGGGMFTNMIEGTMNANHIRAGIEETWASGQKELRIIQSIDPVLALHRVVFNQGIIEEDELAVQKYPLDVRNQYRFLFQLIKLTRDRGALAHDDKLEALAIALRFLKDTIKVDAEKKVASAKSDQMLEWMKNPRGITTNKPGHAMYAVQPPALPGLNAMQRFNR